MSLSQAEIRKLLFTRCETREHLNHWIKFFLGLELPSCIVSEESNSCPLDLIWEVYSKAVSNDDENFSRVLAYASRGALKTLSASILEVLSLLHLGRNVGHMAATRDQSERSQEYVRDFFNKPYIRDFKVGDSKKRVEIVRFKNIKTGEFITEKEHSELEDSLKHGWKQYSNFILIVVCSLKGANGYHSEIFCADEIDTIEGDQVRGYKESKNIPKSRDGLMPITLLVSTRKFSYGLVQQELDQAAKTGLHSRHWNIVDVTEKCGPTRHKPELPMVDLYVNDETLQVLDSEGLEQLPTKEQERFVKTRAFEGCKTCKLFAACKTRLATHQKSTSPMLFPIGEVVAKFREQSLEDVTTQLLCRKASSEGLVLPRLNREIHGKSIEQLYELATGTKLQRPMTKQEFMDFLFAKGGTFYAGIDFGYSHYFACSTVVEFGRYLFLLDVLAVKRLELDEQIAICEKLKKYNTKIFADTAYPQHIATFRRRGFRMMDWDKTPGSVKAGIDLLRMKIMSASGEVEFFFLKDDPGCELAYTNLTSYHYVTSASGEVTDEPAKVDDDICDSVRYAVMNVVAPGGRLRIPRANAPVVIDESPTQPTTESWMTKEIRERAEDTQGLPDRPIKKGKIIIG